MGFYGVLQMNWRDSVFRGKGRKWPRPATADGPVRQLAVRRTDATKPAADLLTSAKVDAAFDGASKVLSAPGGPLVLTDGQRAHCAVLDDGTFLVHATYLVNADYVSAVERAARAANIKLKPAQPVGLDTIRSKYRDVGGDTATVGKMRGMVDTLFARAAQSRVSDIQILPEAAMAQVQFQVQGFLTKPQLRDQIHLSELDAFHTAVFGMAAHGDPILNRHLDQRVTITDRSLLPAGVVGARVQWVPAGMYRHMNVRFLYEKLEGQDPSLESLGMPDEILQYLYFLLSQSSGLVTWAGPTESGKSYSQTCFMLSLIKRFGRQLLIPSLADPPEGFYDGILNYAINTDEDQTGVATVERLTLATLRVSPHVINFAELRSELMAREAFRASTQGKMILATTHCDDALDIPLRYQKLGVDRSDAFSHRSHAAMIAQRLVPHLCPKCSIPIREAVAGHGGEYDGADLDIYRQALGDIAETFRVRGPGCEECVDPEKISIPGLTKRRLYMELVVPDEELFVLLRRERDGESVGKAREHWFKSLNGRSMRLYGLDDLISGRIGVTEYSRFFGHPRLLRMDMEAHDSYRAMLGKYKGVPSK